MIKRVKRIQRGIAGFEDPGAMCVAPGGESNSWLRAARKWGPQPYNHKEQNLPTTRMSLEVDFPPEPSEIQFHEVGTFIILLYGDY